MQILTESEDAFDSQIARYAKAGIVQVPLFFTGFIMGATEANATLQNQTNSGANYSTKLDWRLADTLTNLGLGGINVPNVLNKSAGAPTSYTSVAGKAKFNWTGWINKGLALVVITYAWKHLKFPMGDSAYAIGKCYGTGYSVGGLFDPPGAGSRLNPGGVNMAASINNTNFGNVPNYAAQHAQPNLMAS